MNVAERVGWFIAGAVWMGVVWQWVEVVIPTWHRSWAKKEERLRRDAE